MGPEYNLGDYNPNLHQQMILKPGSPFVKHCHAEHNLARGVCDTIMLGTTTYYQESKAEIGDDTEGYTSFNHNWQEGGITAFSNHWQDILPNWYVLCGSFTDEPIFEDYKDKYYIKDFWAFSAIISKLLLKSVSTNDIAATRDPLLPLNGPFKIVTIGREITYGKMADLNTRYPTDYDKTIASFRKPIRYAHEQEIRLAYQVVADSGKVYDVRKKPKILNIKSVKHQLIPLISLKPFK